VRTIFTEKTKLAALKFCNFNLGDRKAYSMLSPHKYLMMTKGNNSKIVPQQWTMNLVQSTLLNVMKIPHFGKHHEVNAYVKLLLASYHGGYFWLNKRIRIDQMLFNQIIELSMQGPGPQDYYPRKTVDCALSQKIKEAYGNVEKVTRGYKVTSINNGIVHLACQMIARKLVRKNRSTQVSSFVVDLAGKCVEGVQMN
jgi:hypothetical protein